MRRQGRVCVHVGMCVSMRPWAWDVYTFRNVCVCGDNSSRCVYKQMCAHVGNRPYGGPGPVRGWKKAHREVPTHQAWSWGGAGTVSPSPGAPPGPHHGQVVIVCGLAQVQLPLLFLTHALQHAVEHVVIPFIRGLKMGAQGVGGWEGGRRPSGTRQTSRL